MNNREYLQMLYNELTKLLNDETSIPNKYLMKLIEDIQDQLDNGTEFKIKQKKGFFKL